MIRPRYLPDLIVAQLVSVSAFSHGLDPKQPSALRAVHESLAEKRHDVAVHLFVEGGAFPLLRRL